MTNKIFFGLLIGLMLAGSVYCRSDTESGTVDSDTPRYAPYLAHILLPVMFLVFFILTWMDSSAAEGIRMTFSVFFSVFLHICLYYSILIPLLPTLRRRISARACAVLWMLPNYLYFVVLHGAMSVEPLFVLRLPERAAWWILGIWLAGFCAVMLRAVVSHLQFRRRILSGALPVTDGTMVQIWQQELQLSGIRSPRFQLVTSQATVTPLSIGLFRRTIRVVLPQQHYTPEQLHLIFRHELVHIGREDTLAKFFLVFCTAVCWFNPLMWLAMKKCAEDLELSCDETVLLHTDQSQRKEYASLILTTVGDQSGFTTCLSAAADSMRYRLKSIVHPRRSSGIGAGALTVLVVFTLLVLTCGFSTVAYTGKTVDSAFFSGKGNGLYTISRIRDPSHEHFPLGPNLMCRDTMALREYILSLPCDHTYGDYSPERMAGRSLCLYFEDERSLIQLLFSDNWMEINQLFYESLDTQVSRFYLPRTPDWAYIDSLLLTKPELRVTYTLEAGSYPRDLLLTPAELTLIEGTTHTSLLDHHSGEDVSGVFGTIPSQGELTFTLPVEGSLSIIAEGMDGQEGYTVLESDPEFPFAFSVLPYNTRYTVSTHLLRDDGSIYEALFAFEFGPDPPQGPE